MPASKLTIPTITGIHTGIEKGHLSEGMVGAGVDMVVYVTVAAVVVLVVTGRLGRLLILVKMKGLV